MPKAAPFASLLLLILVSNGIAHADPQISERRAERERQRAGKDAKSEQAQPAEPAKYPNATRQEPEGKASAKMGEKLQKLFDTYNAQSMAAVPPLADEIIADGAANAYEKSVAARLAGASQLNIDNAKAMGYVQKAIEFGGLSNNEHFEAMYLIAQLHMQQQQYAEALAAVDRFMSETKTQQPEALVLKGNALYRLKRYPEAEAALKQAVDATPQPKAEWVQLLMGTYADMGKPEEANKLAERLGTAATGSDKQSQLNLAATYMQAGQDAKAIEILQKLRSSGQLDSETDYRNLYAMYINGGKQAEGIQVINEGLQKGLLKPDYATYNALAQAYWFSDKPADAITAFQKAAPLAPDGEAYLNLARALNNEGRAAEAKEAAKQALAKGVKKPEDANRIIGGK